MTTIRYDHTEIKRGGKWKRITDEMKRQLIADTEAVLNNVTDELKVRRNGSSLRFFSSRDSQVVTLSDDYAQDRT